MARCSASEIVQGQRALLSPAGLSAEMRPSCPVCSHWLGMDLEVLRETTAAKKAEFAREYRCMHTKTTRNGERFGWDLKPPYTLAEIEAFEAGVDPGFKLPDEFRTYLTQVSREVFATSYPEEVALDLDEGCCWYDARNYYRLFPRRDRDWDDDRSLYDGMMQIGDDGCEWTTWIVARGNRAGSVWNSSSDGMILSAETFYGYLERRRRFDEYYGG